MFDEIRLLQRYEFESSSPLLVDVGAHHGNVSFPFACKDWRVIAFEPEKVNREAFLEKLKDFPDVTCIDKAVTDESGNIVPFFVSEEHYGIHSLKPFHESHVHKYEVETVRLDEVLEEHKVERVTLLKVDIEGADFLALKGFDVNKYKPEIVMLEFMDDRSSVNFGYTHHDVVHFMGERGYTAFVSEWAPIKEYGREGMQSEVHEWLQCAPYPLDHQPSWGNLIFLPDADAKKFKATLNGYLLYIRIQSLLEKSRKLIKRIPGATSLYRTIKRN